MQPNEDWQAFIFITVGRSTPSLEMIISSINTETDLNIAVKMAKQNQLIKDSIWKQRNPNHFCIYPRAFPGDLRNQTDVGGYHPPYPSIPPHTIAADGYSPWMDNVISAMENENRFISDDTLYLLTIFLNTFPVTSLVYLDDYTESSTLFSTDWPVIF